MKCSDFRYHGGVPCFLSYTLVKRWCKFRRVMTLPSHSCHFSSCFGKKGRCPWTIVKVFQEKHPSQPVTLSDNISFLQIIVFVRLLTLLDPVIKKLIHRWHFDMKRLEWLEAAVKYFSTIDHWIGISSIDNLQPLHVIVGFCLWRQFMALRLIRRVMVTIHRNLDAANWKFGILAFMPWHQRFRCDYPSSRISVSQKSH